MPDDSVLAEHDPYDLMDAEAARLEGWFGGLGAGDWERAVRLRGVERAGRPGPPRLRRGVQRGLLRRGRPGLLRALHLEGRDGHGRLQRARRERPSRPLAGRAAGRVALGLRPHPVGAATPRRPGHDDVGRRPIRPAGRPGTWPASWPPTPTTSGCRRPPPRPTAAWRGGWGSPASRWTRRGRRSRSEPGPGGFTVRAGDAGGRARRRRARRRRQRPAPGRTTLSIRPCARS